MKKRGRSGKVGKVILVGAGPGDPGLLTLRGREALRRAEVVIFDALVNPEILSLAETAEKIFAGKKAGRHLIEQERIHQMLLQFARQGKRIVRLKGGDPFIFGRGGEEASFLVRHRVPFEVIPGVSAGIGAAATAGIPLTDRRFTSHVTFVTGHCGKGEVDWKKLSETGGTLVAFMGLKTLPQIVRALLRAGRKPRTPAAVIEQGTLPAQRVISGTLENILEKVKKANVIPPALTVVGDVVGLGKKLAWFSRKPLQGKKVIVTRPRGQAGELVEKLGDLGAEVLEFPTIEILPPSRPDRIDREIQRMAAAVKPVYDWLVFTSANGVESFFDRMRCLGKDGRIFSGLRIAAIGERTAETLQKKGLWADLIPGEYTNEALFESLKKRGPLQGKKFLLARVASPPPELKESLEKEGALVTELETYRTRPVKAERKKLIQTLQSGKIDYVTFTSSSTVRNFFDPLPPALRRRLRTRFISIGPVTSGTLREYGFKPAREARMHTTEGILEALSNGG
ncbi:MAG: uroporphyrinogen-III C-methyltransferase [Candidatus Omnitrophica bacterium]|nr:uroporphyrinogen-III C-methyltransferase [Candidatus Omnitrophota bacterium]